MAPDLLHGLVKAQVGEEVQCLLGMVIQPIFSTTTPVIFLEEINNESYDDSMIPINLQRTYLPFLPIIYKKYLLFKESFPLYVQKDGRYRHFKFHQAW